MSFVSYIQSVSCHGFILTNQNGVFLKSLLITFKVNVIFEVDGSVAKNSFSLKLKHLNNVKLVQIHVTYCSITQQKSLSRFYIYCQGQCHLKTSQVFYWRPKNNVFLLINPDCSCNCRDRKKYIYSLLFLNQLIFL